MSSASGESTERMDVDTFMTILRRIDEFILTMDQGPEEKDVTDMVEFRKIIEEIGLVARPAPMAGQFRVRMWDALKKHGHISKQHERDRLDCIQSSRVNDAAQSDLSSDEKIAIYRSVLGEPTSGPVAKGGAHFNIATILKLEDRDQGLIHARAAVASFNAVALETVIVMKNLPILLIIAARLVASLLNGLCSECDGNHPGCVYNWEWLEGSS